MYTLNGQNLANFNFIPTKQSGSDLALSGFLDMPERLGKCFHSWPSKNGVEPFTSANEIRFGGRDLSLFGHIVAANRDEAVGKLANLYNAINSFGGLVPLTTDWGTFQVYVKDPIIGDYLSEGILKVTIPFREPAPVMQGILPPSTINNEFGIDGILFSTMGMVLIGLEGDRYNRTATKTIPLTSYQKEGWSIGKTGESKLILKLFIKQPTFATFKTAIGNLYAIWSAPGERNLIVPDDLQRRVFACEGFTISNIRKDNGWYGFIDIPLIESQQAQPIYFLGDNLGNYITDNLNNKILLKWQ